MLYVYVQAAFICLNNVKKACVYPEMCICLPRMQVPTFKYINDYSLLSYCSAKLVRTQHCQKECTTLVSSSSARDVVIEDANGKYSVVGGETEIVARIVASRCHLLLSLLLS